MPWSRRPTIHLKLISFNEQHTYTGNDLRFDTELILEATRNIIEAASTIWLCIRSVSNAVEHMSRCEHQDSNLLLKGGVEVYYQAYHSPCILVGEEFLHLRPEESRKEDTGYGQADEDEEVLPIERSH